MFDTIIEVFSVLEQYRQIISLVHKRELLFGVPYQSSPLPSTGESTHCQSKKVDWCTAHS